MRIQVDERDIAQVPAEGIITTAVLNGDQLYYSGIDEAVTRAAGDQYRAQLIEALGRNPQLRSHVATGYSGMHSGTFNHVIYVVDRFDRTLRELVLEGLHCARGAGLCTVNVPLMRHGEFIRTPYGAVSETLSAINKYGARFATPMIANLVVYRDPALANIFRRILAA